MLSTAQTPDLVPFTRNRLAQALVGIYAVVWIWAAIKPLFFSDWLLENLLVFAGVVFATWLYRRCLICDVSSIMVFLFLGLHTVGSHYTYSMVPLGDWLKEVVGSDRNHYDRIIHFTFGLLITYPVRELLLRRGVASPRWGGFIAFTVIATSSGIYELMEWIAAVVVDPEAGAAFLGTQGDPFDSQKDHVLALIGALVALAVTRFAEKTPARP